MSLDRVGVAVLVVSKERLGAIAAIQDVVMTGILDTQLANHVPLVQKMHSSINAT